MKLFRSASLFVLVSLSLSVANATVQKPIERFKMPTVEEFVLMTDSQRAEVIAAIQEFYKKIEMRQSTSYASEFQIKPLWQRLLSIEEALAQTEGDECVIGGYLSRVKKKGSWLGCPTPDATQWWAAGLQTTYKCPPRSMVCNPLVFGYPSESGSDGCTKITNTLTKDCGEKNKNKTAADVAADLLKKIIPSGKELDPNSDAYKAAMAGLEELETHCNGVKKSQRYGECDVLLARIAPIRVALKTAGELAAAKIAALAPKSCTITPKDLKWAGIETQNLGSGKYVVRAKPHSGEHRVLELTSEPKSPAKIPSKGTDPALTVTFDTEMKTCSVVEDRATAPVAVKKPHDPCTEGPGEGWSEKCAFTDDRAMCSPNDEDQKNITKVWGRTEKRKYGPQGLFGGGPEVQKLIKEDNVEFSVLSPEKLDEAFRRDFQFAVPKPAQAGANNFASALKDLKDSCITLNLGADGLRSGAETGEKRKEKDKNKKTNTFQIVRLKRDKDSVMYTCQNMDKNYSAEKKLDPNHLNFNKGTAIAIYQDGVRAGFVESGEIDKQGDFIKSQLYRPGFTNPIAQRTVMAKEERIDPKAVQKQDKDYVRYGLSSLNLCPDTIKKAGTSSPRAHHKFYTNKEGKQALCDSADGKNFAQAVGLTLDPANGGDNVTVYGKDLDTDASRVYSLAIDKTTPAKCNLFWDDIQLPTSLKIDKASGAMQKSGGI
ncbi:MAG: hypothetical protein K2X47_13610 [Bdellovibrionales bacterium]|nr:hypothetical protein [Bdellovibrionales bacterium]